MNKWSEILTAYQVARLGTVQAAAEELGIHRATVARHVDALEEELGAKLFQRHARGYRPTELGDDLLRVASATAEQFRQLAGRARGRGAQLSGELVVTSVEIVSPMVLGAIAAFRALHPQTQVRYEVSGRVFKLEYGEAHVAIRSGPRPDHPDNVVRLFWTLRNGMYAHRRYADCRGLPDSPDAFPQHSFIGSDGSDRKLPFMRWMDDVVPEDCVVFRSASVAAKFQALRQGIGIGFFPSHEAARDDDILEVVAPRVEWDIPFWQVTHVDLHRSAKVQAFLEVLRGVTP